MTGKVKVLAGFIIEDEPEKGSNVVVVYCEDGSVRVFQNGFATTYPPATPSSDTPIHGLAPQSAPDPGTSPGPGS